MSHFPVFIDFADKNILIVGGGSVAARKVATLQMFGSCITVISPMITDELAGLSPKYSGIKLVDRAACADDICSDYDFCFITSDDHDLNHKLAEKARKLKIPVNTADDPDYCDFYFPAVVNRGNIVVGIGTNGTLPALASELRKKIEVMLPETIVPELEELALMRKNLITSGKKPLEDLHFMSMLDDLMSRIK